MPEDKPSSSDFTIKKKVDESWKETIDKERHPDDEHKHEPPVLPEISFTNFLSSLGVQTLASLGELEDPSGAKGKADIEQARYLIDTLHMLSEKTKGNLSKEESVMMQNLLYELQLKFVEKSRPA